MIRPPPRSAVLPDAPLFRSPSCRLSVRPRPGGSWRPRPGASHTPQEMGAPAILSAELVMRDLLRVAVGAPGGVGDGPRLAAGQHVQDAAGGGGGGRRRGPPAQPPHVRGADAVPVA